MDKLDFSVLWSGILAGFGVAIPVGGISILLVGLAARAPGRVAVAAALGVASVDGFYALAAVIGGTAAARLVAPAMEAVRWVGAVALAGLAVRTAAGALRISTARAVLPWGPDSPARAYFALVGLTALNPLTIVYFVVLAVGGNRGVLFVVGVFVASAVWQLAVVSGGNLLGRAATGPTGRLVTALCSSVVVLYFAVRLLL